MHYSSKRKNGIFEPYIYAVFALTFKHFKDGFYNEFKISDTFVFIYVYHSITILVIIIIFTKTNYAVFINCTSIFRV